MNLAKAKQLNKKQKQGGDVDDPVYQKLSKENTIKIIELDIPRTYPSLGILSYLIFIFKK